MTSYAFADLITFTRASAATYVNSSGNIATAASGSPRFDYDPVTLSPRGFLVEEQRTNLITYSAEIDNAAWAKNAVTVIANAITSPDGTTSADSIDTGSATNFHSLIRSISLSAGQSYCLSIYAKAGTASYLQILFDHVAGTNDWVNFDLSNGTISAGLLSAEIEPAGNGWYRCTVIGVSEDTVAKGIYISIVNSPTAGRLASYAGTSKVLYLWGAQLEAGSFATSYIPTTASQVTRTADDAVIQSPNFSSWYNSVEGTLSIEGSVLATVTGNRVAANLHNSASAGIMIGNSAGGTATDADFYVANSGDQAWLRFTSAVSAGTVFKISGAYKANDFAASANGATTITDTSGTVPTATSLRIGRNTGSQYFNGHIRSIKYYPTRLTNAQLQALTA